MGRMTLAEKLARKLSLQIESGGYAPGEKLPSLRELARLHGCSKNTAVEAFERLVSSGRVLPRVGSGFYVSDGVPARQDLEARPLQRAMDIAWLLRQQLESTPEQLRVGDGFPPVAWLAEARIERLVQRVARKSRVGLYRYGPRGGYLPLRQHLVRKLGALGIESEARQIVLTLGANHAMDVVLRRFVQPGDPVLVDDPGYYPLFGKLELCGARAVGIPRRPDGPDVAALQAALQDHPARLFITQSIGHNPTGSDISAANAHRILQVAERHGLMIVENDPLADFKPATLPRMAALDQLQRTLYVGSFSKSVAASLRVGFIACHPDLASELADIKMLLHINSSELSERVLDAMLSEGHFLRHVAKLRGKLEEATSAAYRQMEAFGANVFCTPAQSLYVWASLPGVKDSMVLARELLSSDVVLAPGAIFSVQAQRTEPRTRVNVAAACDPRFVSALRARLG